MSAYKQYKQYRPAIKAYCANKTNSIAARMCVYVCAYVWCVRVYVCANNTNNTVCFVWTMCLDDRSVLFVLFVSRHACVYVCVRCAVSTYVCMCVCGVYVCVCAYVCVRMCVCANNTNNTNNVHRVQIMHKCAHHTQRTPNIDIKHQK